MKGSFKMNIINTIITSVLTSGLIGVFIINVKPWLKK